MATEGRACAHPLSSNAGVRTFGSQPPQMADTNKIDSAVITIGKWIVRILMVLLIICLVFGTIHLIRTIYLSISEPPFLMLDVVTLFEQECPNHAFGFGQFAVRDIVAKQHTVRDAQFVGTTGAAVKDVVSRKSHREVREPSRKKTNATDPDAPELVAPADGS